MNCDSQLYFNSVNVALQNSIYFCQFSLCNFHVKHLSLFFLDHNPYKNPFKHENKPNLSYLAVLLKHHNSYTAAI